MVILLEYRLTYKKQTEMFFKNFYSPEDQLHLHYRAVQRRLLNPARGTNQTDFILYPQLS